MPFNAIIKRFLVLSECGHNRALRFSLRAPVFDLITMTELVPLLEDIQSCRLCEPNLPHGANPVLRVDSGAKLLIAAQAPGIKVHETGVPFNDPSGDRLRAWMGVDRDVFYDESKVAIVPMGFCYPGRGRSGDLPPRKECADTWRADLLKQLINIQFTLVIGQYAFRYHMPERKGGLTDAVKDWHYAWPNQILLPHPSPRNNIWLKRNGWFERDVVPLLRRRVQEVLA